MGTVMPTDTANMATVSSALGVAEDTVAGQAGRG